MRTAWFSQYETQQPLIAHFLNFLTQLLYLSGDIIRDKLVYSLSHILKRRLLGVFHSGFRGYFLHKELGRVNTQSRRELMYHLRRRKFLFRLKHADVMVRRPYFFRKFGLAKAASHPESLQISGKNLSNIIHNPA